MRAAALLAAALVLQGAAANPDGPPVAQPRYMRYLRALDVPQGSGQACAVLDAEIFPHAAPSLIDLRVFPSPAAGAPSPAAPSQSTSDASHEVPYAITLSESASQETTQAHLLNLGAGAAHTIAFDLTMPQRPYSSVTLDVDPTLHDFLGTAAVTASDALGGKGHSVSFGSFTIFDLTAQHLSRSTTLPLPESTFPYLHISLAMADAPGAHGPEESASRFVPSIVTGATVPPSREAQAIYTAVAETRALGTHGRESIATFEIPARVPVERVEFLIAPTFKGNFSRDVRVTATAAPIAKGAAGEASASNGNESVDADQRPPLPETLTSNILRVRANEAGREINSEDLTVPAVLGANLQRAAKVEVAIENGDDQPLPIAAVRLEMRQRRLCFDAVAATAGPLALYYGDPTLLAPVYDYERLFTPSEKPLIVTLGPQLANPDFTPRPGAPRSFIDRHPEVLWIALIAAIAALGFVALKSGKSVGKSN
jgi:hypothetical protein